jgi:hypothetical protein
MGPSIPNGDLDWLFPKTECGLWLPARSLEKGLVLRSTELRSAPIWDQRIRFWRAPTFVPPRAARRVDRGAVRCLISRAARL